MFRSRKELGIIVTPAGKKMIRKKTLSTGKGMRYSCLQTKPYTFSAIPPGKATSIFFYYGNSHKLEEEGMGRRPRGGPETTPGNNSFHIKRV